MGMYTAPAPGTRTGPNTVQRYPAGDPRRYANQGGVPPGSMPGKPQLVGGPVNRPIINPPPAPMPPARPMPPPQPPVGRPGGPQLIGGPVDKPIFGGPPSGMPTPGRPVIGPPPAPMPSMPYGGPIGMPGGPFTPRPDLGPGVGFGPGLPPPGGLPTNGQGTGKSNQDNMIRPQIGGTFGVDFGSPSDPGYNEARAQAGLPPIYDTPMGGGQANPGNPYGDGSSPRPLPPGVSMGFGMPAPNFASALGTASPLLNTIRR